MPSRSDSDAPPILGNGATADPMDDFLFALVWIAQRRLDAVPLGIGEVNQPAEFIAAHTGIGLPIVRRMIEFIENEHLWRAGDSTVSFFERWRAICADRDRR
jgi:hypothetical protein